MIITHPNKVRWLKKITADPLDNYGKSHQKKIRSTISNLPNTNVSFSIEPLTKEFFKWFTPLYESTINAKDSGVVFDVPAMTLNNPSKVPYFSLTVYESSTPIGETIFAVKEEQVNIAYKIYNPKWNQNALQAHPSLYADFLISAHCQQINKASLSHGKDRNPYGPNASIGLAIFKLSTGYTPLVPASYETQTIRLEEITHDTFLLSPSLQTNQNHHLRGHLVVASEKSLEKWGPLLKYPEIVDVEIIKKF